MGMKELETWTGIDDEKIDEMLKRNVNEYVILRTCNRFEIYIVTNDTEKTKMLIEKLSNELNSKNWYFLEDMDSIKHLLRVTSGMESMIIGENQIQGQVKNAIETSIKNGRSGKYFHYIFMKALSTGKEVRDKTKISNGIISIPQLAIKILDDKRKDYGIKNVCIVGTGHVSKILIKYMQELNFNITVSGRNARKLENIRKNYHVKILNLRNLDPENFDALISAVSSKSPIMEISGEKPFVIDLGNPRNVKCIECKNYIDLDKLKEYSKRNLNYRKSEMKKAEEIVEKNLRSIEKRLKIMENEDLISKIYRRIDEIRNEEMIETLKIIGNENKETIENLTRSMANRIMGIYIKKIKKIIEEGDEKKISVLKEIFG